MLVYDGFVDHIVQQCSENGASKLGDESTFGRNFRVLTKLERLVSGWLAEQ